MNLGFRLYDPVIGRFLAVDPYFSSQPGYSPYHYSYNNPVNYSDRRGLYGIPEHTFCDGNFLNNLICDGPCFFINKLHFDNCPDFAAVKSIIDAAGGFGNLNPHIQGDFFCHSNIADIWVRGNYKGVMPLWDEIDWDSDFGKDVMANLKTTSYRKDGYGKNDHDHGYDKSKDGEFGAKEERPATNNGNQLRAYEVARNAYYRQMVKNGTMYSSDPIENKIITYGMWAQDALWMASNVSWASEMISNSAQSWNGLWATTGSKSFQNYLYDYQVDLNLIEDSYKNDAMYWKQKRDGTVWFFNNWRSLLPKGCDI